ncbi:transport protein SEC31, partial [Trifolium pratense]
TVVLSFAVESCVATQLVVASDEDRSPSIGIAYELPAGTNWNFDVHWYSKIPGVIASSFGKIGIYKVHKYNLEVFLNSLSINVAIKASISGTLDS